MRLVVWVDGVDGAPHDVDPPLCRLNRQKCEHARNRGVEVEARFDPLTTVVVAVPHRLDVLLGLFRAQIFVSKLA